MRLGAQAAGAALGMAGAYYTRGRGFLPWLLGGIAVGFGANLVKMGLSYYVMPAVLTVDNPTDKTLANRLFPLEQTKLQDTVTKFLEEKTKAQGTLETYTPGSPLDNPQTPAQGVVYLGKARKAPGQGNTLGAAAPKLVATGRLGKCNGCGGSNGCWTSCPDLKLCSECGAEDPVAMRCKVVVEAGSDIVALASAANVDINQVNALNGGGGPDTYWVVGNTVTLPYAMCTFIQHSTPSPIDVAVPAVPPMTAEETALIATPALAYPTVAGIAAENEAILYR
jgi:hypothetical protein